MIGKHSWIIGEGYLPEQSHGDQVSHESVCVLNLSDTDAIIKLKLYFEDSEPTEPFVSHCKAQRTHHIRLDQLNDIEGNPVPRGVPYAIKVDSDVPVVVQHTRLDTSQAELALMTTMGYS